jgi:hypothetical protein
VRSTSHSTLCFSISGTGNAYPPGGIRIRVWASTNGTTFTLLNDFGILGTDGSGNFSYGGSIPFQHAGTRLRIQLHHENEVHLTDDVFEYNCGSLNPADFPVIPR